MTALDDVPLLRRPGSNARRRSVPRTGSALGAALPRRTVFQAATAAGFAALGVFSAAREAYADGYDIWTGACPSYAVDHNCSPGCGPSTVYTDACVTSGTNTGFHKNDGVTWTLRPNQCYSGTYDGWLWRYSGACGTCGCGIERRCHDGYRNTGSGWVKSICRWTTDCDCAGTVSWPTIARGATGPDVYTVQHLVTYHGFTTTADGIFGANTEARVSEFQTSRGLSPTGSVGPATWPVLVVTVRRGDVNAAVRGAQWQLNKHGYGLTVDGNFGTLTETAVKGFQSANGLTADGVVGSTTWRYLTGTA
ncbi:peptidoglycan-binding protein [Streptomyces sp. NPDC051940]|uniref:peptidoglycan-binding domain-containing protein n=1 Tax=Streptomyces sp. NPDC051940 TaxID=3155675 RepID=UPI00341EF5B3